ncbi:MAG TPA: class I SAM-dependent methyltransferase [Candidatus Dormibacteraeota bacterium]|nr:class I SAM-dependent methyltransferase [Candidatus Dormibacteraeota bacterium]
MNKKNVDWPQQLFIKHGNLFLKLLENRTDSKKLEVDGLVRIFEEFNVPKHARILDVSCGIGRHSIPLAERGYDVLGLDLSPLFIAKANATSEARKLSSRAKFRVADVREIASVLHREDFFNVVLNLWSSHGYYGEEEDVRMFTALRNRTVRNGLLVDDTVNRDYLIINPQPTTVDMVGDMELRECRRFDPETSWHESNWSFSMKRGQDFKLKAKLRIHHRVYSLHELRALLQRAGWQYVKSYGEFDLAPFKSNSKRIIACCRA